MVPPYKKGKHCINRGSIYRHGDLLVVDAAQGDSCSQKGDSRPIYWNLNEKSEFRLSTGLSHKDRGDLSIRRKINLIVQGNPLNDRGDTHHKPWAFMS